MTASTKASVKATFASGAFPTESNFVDLIDSYMDTSPGLVAVASAALSGVGVPQFTSPSTVVFRKLTPIGIASMDASAAASAMTAIGILSAGQGAMKAATSAALLLAIGITSVGRQMAEAATTAALQSVIGVPSAATSAEMALAASFTTFVTPGILSFHLAVPKAIVLINDLGSAAPNIQPLYNTVGGLSCARTATGSYDFAWGKAFASAPYFNLSPNAVGNTIIWTSAGANVATKTQIRTTTDAGGATDPTAIYIYLYGVVT